MDASGGVLRLSRRMPAKDPVLVANGQGFWGDSILGPVRLVNEGPLDYLTLDYLAEVTLSIMQKLRARDPSKGYATDFVRLVDRILPQLVEKDVRVIANAGGVNPRACVDALVEVVKKHGVSGVKIGVVEGDDILGRLDELLEAGEELRNMDTGEPLSTVRDRVTSANVYLGAFPIAEALDGGARIVLTGRGTDPGLVLGPLIHEFGWSADDLDRLAAGTVAGHIVECGAQCTGGNYTDWRSVPDMARIGYPVIEARADGSFAVTKHAGTGGLVNESTVLHQLAYEMGDPSGYVTPDCIADFTSFALADEGDGRVEVSGVRGRAATDTYKVSLSYHDGWKATGQLTVSGPDALAKARLCADIVWERLALDGFEYGPDERMVEYVGANVCHDGIPVAGADDPPEVVLRMGVKGPDRAKVDRFGSELVPLVTSGPPGVTGFAGGRPKATEIIGYWPALVGKDKIQTQVTCVVEEVSMADRPAFPHRERALRRQGRRLERRCDRASSNEAYAFLKEALTVDVVRAHFAGDRCNGGGVERFEADNMRAVELPARTTASAAAARRALKTDAQGKTHGLAVLRLELEVPDAVLAATPAPAEAG